MGFEIYSKQNITRTRNRKVLVCERDVKNVHFTIVDDTVMRMSTKELDTVAQTIHDEIQENSCKGIYNPICKKVIMENSEVFCAAKANGPDDWTIRISDPLKFVC